MTSSQPHPVDASGSDGSGESTLTRAHLLWWVAALALVFFLASASVWLAPPDSTVAAWWPASGVAVALGLRTPRRLLPFTLLAIFVVTALANAGVADRGTSRRASASRTPARWPA